MRFLADENFNNEIVRGLVRRVPKVEIIRAQDTELAGEPDQVLLEWAAKYGYIILSHDLNTMRGLFCERIKAGLPVLTLFLVDANKPIGPVIESLELIIGASEASEYEGEIRFLPLA